MKVIGVHKYFDCKVYEFKYLEKYDDLKKDDVVILQDEDNKEDYGKMVYSRTQPKDPLAVISELTILRKATLHDEQKIEANKERALLALETCKEKIAKYNLEMFLMKAIFSFDASKVNFIFTANDRVDFRELVKDLAKELQKQIHLQQIGPRDKAKIVGGFGRCGQEACCCKFLSKLESITMDMVRVQNLTNKGSEKLSGLCGKLLCCLKYEVSQYDEIKRSLPEIGDKVILKNKEEGTVQYVDILNKKIRLYLNNDSMQIFDQNDIKQIIKKTASRKKEEIISPDVLDEKAVG